MTNWKTGLLGAAVMGLAGCEKKLAVGTYPVRTLQSRRAFAGATAA